MTEHRRTFDELLAEADALLTCSRCGEDKPVDGYYRQQLKRRGRPYCKLCRRAAVNASIRKERQRARARRAETAAKVTALKLTLACVDCGWSPQTQRECWRLHFDHIDPAAKWKPVDGAPLPARRSYPAFRAEWPWARIEAELALCEPRCVSCHGYRTNRQRRGFDPYPIPWSAWSATPPLPLASPSPAQSAS